MKVERLIFIFNKQDESLFKEINADVLTIGIISQLFTAAADDPKFYRPYEIKDFQYNELIKHISELQNYSIRDFDLFLEAVII